MTDRCGTIKCNLPAVYAAEPLLAAFWQGAARQRVSKQSNRYMYSCKLQGRIRCMSVRPPSFTTTATTTIVRRNTRTQIGFDSNRIHSSGTYCYTSYTNRARPYIDNTQTICQGTKVPTLGCELPTQSRETKMQRRLYAVASDQQNGGKLPHACHSGRNQSYRQVSSVQQTSSCTVRRCNQPA